MKNRKIIKVITVITIISIIVPLVIAPLVVNRSNKPLEIEKSEASSGSGNVIATIKDTDNTNLVENTHAAELSRSVIARSETIPRLSSRAERSDLERRSGQAPQSQKDNEIATLPSVARNDKGCGLDFIVEYNDSYAGDNGEELINGAGYLKHELMPTGDIAWLGENGITVFDMPAPVINGAKKLDVRNEKD